MAKSDPSTGKPARGRTSITGSDLPVSATRRHTEAEHKTQASRPVSSGAGPRRGDRRDMHPLYSTGKTHTKGGKRGPIICQ